MYAAVFAAMLTAGSEAPAMYPQQRTLVHQYSTTAPPVVIYHQTCPPPLRVVEHHYNAVQPAIVNYYHIAPTQPTPIHYHSHHYYMKGHH